MEEQLPDFLLVRLPFHLRIHGFPGEGGALIDSPWPINSQDNGLSLKSLQVYFYIYNGRDGINLHPEGKRANTSRQAPSVKADRRRSTRVPFHLISPLRSVPYHTTAAFNSMSQPCFVPYHSRAPCSIPSPLRSVPYHSRVPSCIGTPSAIP